MQDIRFKYLIFLTAVLYFFIIWFWLLMFSNWQLMDYFFLFFWYTFDLFWVTMSLNRINQTVFCRPHFAYNFHVSPIYFHMNISTHLLISIIHTSLVRKAITVPLTCICIFIDLNSVRFFDNIFNEFLNVHSRIKKKK